MEDIFLHVESVLLLVRCMKVVNWPIPKFYHCKHESLSFVRLTQMFAENSA